MKTNHATKNGSHMERVHRLTIKRGILMSILMLAGIQMLIQAQDPFYTKPSWWFGVAGGSNYNFYRGSTQTLTADFTAPAAFHKGRGIGLFLAPHIEYHRPDSKVGFMLQVGYDSRKGSFQQIVTPCNCPADLLINLNYLTVEPILRYAPFNSDFYLFAGPRLAFNWLKKFTYKQGINPQYPGQVAIDLPWSRRDKTWSHLFCLCCGLTGYKQSFKNDSTVTLRVVFT